MRHVLCNNASIELLDREDHVPVLAPDYVAVFDGELLEVLWLDVAVVLRMWMCKDEWLEIHSLGRAVAEEDVKAHVSCIFSSYDVKSCGFHCYLYAGLKQHHRIFAECIQMVVGYLDIFVFEEFCFAF